MIGVTTKIILDKRVKTKANTYAVKLRITFQREQKYYPLSKRFTIEEWDKIQDPNCRGKNKQLKLYFSTVEERATSIIDGMEKFSFSKFEELFNNKASNKKDLYHLFDVYINQLKGEDRLTTATSHSCTLSAFKKYANHKNKKYIHLRDISIDWLTNYEKWQLNKGLSPSTIGIHMRNLRTILNVAIENGNFDKEDYPFGKRKYMIPATRNIKKALKIEDIKKLVEYSTDDEMEEKARDMWLFSYLANGMNMKDICLLKFKDIDTRNITFVREKTRRSTKADSKPITVPVIPKIMDIINKWGNRETNPNNYLFDVLKDNDSQADIDRKTRQFIKTINIRTKRIGKALEFKLKLTTYVARHSYATILKRSGAPIDFISESLGHKDLATTENYLDSFEDETKRKYQSNLLDFKSNEQEQTKSR